MTSDKSAQPSITEMLHMPKEQRWMDLSAYSMALKLAIYKDGNAIVVEYGDRAPDALTKLGFGNVDGEWISANIGFLPREVQEALPDAKVRLTPTYEVVLDRRDRTLPETLPIVDAQLAKRGVKFNQRVVAAVASAPKAELTAHPTFWFAAADLLDQDVHGFGSSPEVAMSALVSAWKDIATRECLHAEMLSTYRDSISVVAAEMGKGYAKGIGDKGWYKEALMGSDERFDGILEELSRPAPRRSGPKL